MTGLKAYEMKHGNSYLLNRKGAQKHITAQHYIYQHNGLKESE